MADLSARDVEKAQFVFSIYDFEGNNTTDAVHLGDMLRALNQNPTLALIEKLGGTKKKNEKKLKLDEFLPIFSQVKKEKEQGTFDDFLEALKLYDKEENGTMMAAELGHVLLSLGEKLSEDECRVLLEDCMETPDDDGYIHFELTTKIHKQQPPGSVLPKNSLNFSLHGSHFPSYLPFILFVKLINNKVLFFRKLCLYLILMYIIRAYV